MLSVNKAKKYITCQIFLLFNKEGKTYICIFVYLAKLLLSTYHMVLLTKYSTTKTTSIRVSAHINNFLFFAINVCNRVFTVFVTKIITPLFKICTEILYQDYNKYVQKNARILYKM